MFSSILSMFDLVASPLSNLNQDKYIKIHAACD